MSPLGDEREAREQIDHLLTAAGWDVCDMGQQNLLAHRGVAIREYPLPGHGFADYMLYVDGKAAGVVEAKKVGVTLIGVETQSAKYTDGLPEALHARRGGVAGCLEAADDVVARHRQPDARRVAALHVRGRQDSQVGEQVVLADEGKARLGVGARVATRETEHDRGCEQQSEGVAGEHALIVLSSG